MNGLEPGPRWHLHFHTSTPRCCRYSPPPAWRLLEASTGAILTGQAAFWV
jgi:hypothetical protein